MISIQCSHPVWVLHTILSTAREVTSTSIRIKAKAKKKEQKGEGVDLEEMMINSTASCKTLLLFSPQQHYFPIITTSLITIKLCVWNLNVYLGGETEKNWVAQGLAVIQGRAYSGLNLVQVVLPLIY